MPQDEKGTEIIDIDMELQEDKVKRIIDSFAKYKSPGSDPGGVMGCQSNFIRHFSLK